MNYLKSLLLVGICVFLMRSNANAQCSTCEPGFTISYSFDENNSNEVVLKVVVSNSTSCQSTINLLELDGGTYFDEELYLRNDADPDPEKLYQTFYSSPLLEDEFNGLEACQSLTIPIHLNYLYQDPVYGQIECVITRTVEIIKPSDALSEITVDPTGKCGEFTISYNGTITNPEWAFGDGKFDESGVSSIIHTYPSNGVYTISLKGDEFVDCQDVTTVTVTGYATVDFNYVLEDPCDVEEGVTVTITDYDNNDGYSFIVNNGPLLSATGETTTLTANLVSGKNTVQLIRNSNGCSSSISKDIFVSNIPATFTAKTPVCMGNQNLIVSNVSQGAHTYLWEIYDGVTQIHTDPNSGMFPSYDFTQPGTYEVKLTTTFKTGYKDGAGNEIECTDTYTQDVVVSEEVEATFTATKASGCGEYNFAINNPLTTITNYTIDFGDNSLASGTDPSDLLAFNHSYTANGLYDVTLTVYNGGCKDVYTTQILVEDQIIINVIKDADYLCNGSEIILIADVANINSGTGGVVYDWSETTLGSGLSTTNQYKVTAAGEYEVSASLNGCTVISQPITIEELPLPTATIDETIPVTCAGNENGAVKLIIDAALLNQGCLVNGVLVDVSDYLIDGFYLVEGLNIGDNYLTIANQKDPSCYSKLPVTISNDAPFISNINVTSSACDNNTGSISLTANNNTGGSIAWFTLVDYPTTPLSGETGSSISNLGAGDYVIEITGASGCVISEVINVSTTQFSLAIENSSLAVCVPSGVINLELNDFGAGVGVGNLVWQKMDELGVWQLITPDNVFKNGDIITGVIANGPGIYQVLASFNGCDYTLPFALKPTYLQIALTKKDGYCAGENVAIIAQVAGGDGNYTNTWTTSGAGTSTSEGINAEDANIYEIEELVGSLDVELSVEDDNGCLGTQTYTVIPNDPIHMVACGTTTPVYEVFDMEDIELDVEGKVDESASAGVNVYTFNVTGFCEVAPCAIGGNSPSATYSFSWYLPKQEVIEDRRVIFTEDDTDPNILEYTDPVDEMDKQFNLPSFTYVDADFPSYDSQTGEPVAFKDDNHFYPFYLYHGAGVVTFNKKKDPYVIGGVFYTITVPVTVTASQLVYEHVGPAKSSHFLPGENIYEVYVTDDNGCKNGPYAIKLDVTVPTGHPEFKFVWAKYNNDNEEEEPEEEDEILIENMLEASNTMVSKVSKCMQESAKEMAVEFDTKCFDISTFRDEFVLSYEVKEHHYTLYYYDRAGQLTKTVPPAGVDFLLEGEISELLAFREFGSTVSGRYIPDHEMQTKYQYNGLGQLINQETPDGGGTNFIYDGLNRLRFSQNAQQAEDNTYSYTKYDELGRIIEVGESTHLAALAFVDPTNPTNVTLADDAGFPNNDYTDPQAPVTYNTQVTRTAYTTPVTAVNYYGLPQRYLQNRVSYVHNDEDGVENTTIDNNYTYYSYDAHGNVEWLVQEVAGLGQNYIKYDYDLISGNVLKVSYNEYRADRFYHQYSYDAENRLTLVETSRDGLIWDKDANYEYYQHGPLKRSVVGEDHVQGLDYLYTIHGWLKSINTPSLSKGSTGVDGLDKDGQLAVSQLNTEVASDRFGMSLGYYSGDYKNANTFHNTALTTPQLNGEGLFASIGNPGNDLYNGNITQWGHSQLFHDGSEAKITKARASTYEYDVLNRIKSSQNQQQTTVGGTAWSAANNDFRTGYTYDANGNIQELDRYKEDGTHMDDLTYLYYYKNSNGDFEMSAGYSLTDPLYPLPLDAEPTNRLFSVIDDKNVGESGELIGTHAYQYDEIGNLIREEATELLDKDNTGGLTAHTVNTDITWTVYGKVATVHKEISKSSSIYEVTDIKFSYDASGNRIGKTVARKYDVAGGITNPTSITYAPEEIGHTYYVRDAQGNTLAVYEDKQEDAVADRELHLIEQPIYGSDRLGQNTNAVLLAAVDAGELIPTLGTGVENKAEYQNWVISANGKLAPGIDNLCNTKIDLINFDKDNNNLYSASEANEFLGIAKNGVAVAENTDGELQFYTVLTKNYLGNKDACLVYDASGKLMEGTELITNVNTESKPIVVNLTGSNKYALVTLNKNNQPEYHIVDMNTLGYGINTSTNAGSISQTDVAISLADNAPKEATYGLHFTGFEDHINKKSVVYTTRYLPSITQGGVTEIVAYEFAGTNTTPIEYVLYSLPTCADTKQGELTLSKDGRKLLWYHHDEFVAGFDHRMADIYEIELEASKTAVSGKVEVISISGAGNYGSGSVEGGANGIDIYYAQRGIYKELKSSGTDPDDLDHISEKQVWKYDPINGNNLSNITPLNPLTPYLFSEIKRGPDGLLYMPNMAKEAAQMQVWDGVSNSIASLSAGADYQLSGSTPTQVFKFFGTSPINLTSGRVIGKKQYELKDHLGNVRVVISDEKLLDDVNANNIIDAGDFFYPNVKSFADYFPFGQVARKYMFSEMKVGFNGKRMDNDMGNTEGAVYDYGFRIYDARIARFTSVDPLFKSYPFYGPYNFSGNKPIAAIDLDGLEEFLVIRYFDNEKLIGLAIIKLPNSAKINRESRKIAYKNVQIEDLLINESKIQAQIIDEETGLSRSKVLSELEPKEKLSEDVLFRLNRVMTVANPRFKLNLFGAEDSWKDNFEADEKAFIDEGRENLREFLGESEVAELSDVQGERIQVLALPPGSGITFQENSAVLTDEGKSVLKGVAIWMKAFPNTKYQLIGHTNTTGATNANLLLSQKRAAAAKSYLEDEFNISEDRLTSSGKGESEIINKPDGLEDKDKSRRIEIKKVD